MQSNLKEPFKVSLRSSQVKFEARDLSFNVIRASTYGQGYLNRQVIILLYCLGVPESYFMEAQNKAFKFGSFEGIAAKIREGKVSKRFLLGKQFQTVLRNAAMAKLRIENEPMISSVVYGMQLSMY